MGMCVQSVNSECSITFTFIKDLMDCIHRDPAVSAKHCFFLGNVTTLHTHIARWVEFLLISFNLPCLYELSRLANRSRGTLAHTLQPSEIYAMRGYKGVTEVPLAGIFDIWVGQRNIYNGLHKQIPSEMDGIYMELAWIPPGMLGHSKDLQRKPWMQTTFEWLCN